MNKKPTHKLGYLNKETGEKGDIGVGWENEDGSISIKLNVLVKLPENNFNSVFTLFKIRTKEEWSEAYKTGKIKKKPLTTQSSYADVQAAINKDAEEGNTPF